MKQGDKILVVVDNVHSWRTSAIFYAMDIMISSFNYIENVIFLLAATLPEYDSFVKDRSNHVVEGKEAIMKFNLDPKFRFDLPFFTKDEIKGFIKKYIGNEFLLRFTYPDRRTRSLTAEDETALIYLSEKILKETRGHPMLVKFSLLGNGLQKDVSIVII